MLPSWVARGSQQLIKAISRWVQSGDTGDQTGVVIVVIDIFLEDDAPLK